MREVIEMNQPFTNFAQGLFVVLIPLTVFLVTLLVGFILRRILFNKLSKWAKNTKSEIDDIVIAATKGPFIIWCLMLGIYFAIETSRLPENLAHILGKILLVLGILSVTLVLANISTKFVKIYSAKLEGTLPITSLTQNVARIIIFGVGILIILNSLGVSITPILATLGVGGLAVALALQDTLSNLFAGFHIIAARQVKIGDYIRLDSGEEGYITDINWRTTKIRTLPNNVILIPNAKLIQTIITNYYLPNREVTFGIDIGVHYNSDLEKVEKITSEVAREVMKSVRGGVPEFEPAVRYNAFGEFGVSFTVGLKASEFVDQHLIKHEFIKRLHERYKKEGIIIPYPIRTINYEKEIRKQDG